MTGHSTTAAIYDASDRTANPWLIFMLALGLVGVAASYALITPDEASRLTVLLLIFCSFVGIAALFAFAAGFMQFTASSARQDISKIITDITPDALIVTQGEGHVLYANAAYLHLSGTRPPAALHTVERLFSGAPEISEAIYRLAQAAREGKGWSEELRMSPPLSGTEPAGWYRIRVRPLDQLGKQAVTLWTISDITRERIRHENVFQELKHAIDFLDHSPAGFFSAEPNGLISYLNATLAQWLGYDLAQVGSGGLMLCDIIAGQSIALLQIASGRVGEVRTEQIDLDLKRFDGQNLPVRLLHRVAFGHDGLPGASRTLVMNRAYGEEPSETLRAAEVRLARFFNQTPMAIASVMQTGQIIQANPAFARLCPDVFRDSGHQRTIYACIVERDHDRLQTALLAAVQGKSEIAPMDVMLSGQMVGVKERTARFFVSTDEGGDEEGTAAHIFALDTTEQRVLEENFTQSQKMNAIGQLAGGIAHDFNNVLTAIIGYSDLLLANHRSTDPAFQDIMQIKQNANRAAGLVRQLLAFSRRQTLRPQVLLLSDVISDLQMLLQRLVGEKVEIDVKHGRDLWLVRADLNQFEQVMVNLVVNARDAMPDGGKITLRTANVQASDYPQYHDLQHAQGLSEYLLIEVIDTGGGIPEEIRGKIFEPFFTTKEVGKGTGLGLSTVYGIIKQTEGWIYCESQLDEGTTFRIFLPRHIPTEQEMPAKKEEQKIKVEDATGCGTVLLVEDEEAVRAFGARALTSRGYRVLEAASGLEALQVIEEEEGAIDLIVSDVVMPGMDGPTMYTELRNRNIDCKVIFVSGYAEDAFARNLPEGGDFGFLPKPFSLKQLIETVKSNLRK